MLNIHLERKVEVNQWIVKARWFYIVGIFLIGVLTKVISKTNVDFSFWEMFSFVVVFIFINSYFDYSFKKIKNEGGEQSFVNFLSWSQVVSEIITFTVVMHMAGGVESISDIFFFLPVVSAALIFGAKGGIIAAFMAAVVVNSLVVFEFYGYIPHVSRYGIDTLEFKNLSVALTKTLTTSIFYMIVGFFGGYGTNLLFKREQSLEDNTNQLNYKTKLLALREKKLSEINYQLFEIKNKISAIINNFIDPIIFINNRNRISLINPAARDILGLTKEDLGKKILGDDNFSMNNFKEVVRINFKVDKMLDENNQVFEEMSFEQDGHEKTYKIITTPVCDNDNVCYGFIKVFYDLTREKIIDRLKSEFISIAAHQLRTPLTAIKWVIKMILDGDAGPLNDEQTELLKKGYESNERIIALVNDLLNVSRIEEGRFGYNFAMSSFNMVIENVVKNLERALEKNKLHLTIKKPDSMPDIYMDSERMILVLQNLLDNSIKYTPEGGNIEIGVELLSSDLMKVYVKDSGVGIPEVDKVKLFSKFFRASNVIRMETEGTGLGLFIMKNIVEKHKGKVYIESQEGKGTEIGFTMPLK